MESRVLAVNTLMGALSVFASILLGVMVMINMVAILCELVLIIISLVKVDESRLKHGERVRIRRKTKYQVIVCNSFYLLFVSVYLRMFDKYLGSIAEKYGIEQVIISIFMLYMLKLIQSNYTVIRNNKLKTPKNYGIGWIYDMELKKKKEM